MERKMEYKLLPFQVIGLDTEGRTVEGYAAVFGNLDLVGDRIMPGAFAKTLVERGQKVKFLWQHQPGEPIGKPLEMREDERGLYIKAVISDTARGRDALALLRDGAVDGFSIGYDAIVTEPVKEGPDIVRLLKEIRLWEFSLVTFPANEEAGVTALKGASGSTSLPIADRDRGWDANAAVARVRQQTGSEDAPSASYRNAFFWFDGENAGEFGAYKLPFADVIDGELTAVPRAVFAVAAALQGGRGGVDIPDGDAGAVRSRVARYYARMREQFDDEGIVPPWEKGTDGPTEEKVGRAISTAREKRIRERCKAAVEAIGDLMAMVDELYPEQEPDNDTESDTEAGKSLTPPTSAEAGPDSNETTSTDMELLAVTRAKLKTLEVYSGHQTGGNEGAGG